MHFLSWNLKFDVDDQGRVVLQPAGPRQTKPRKDRFEAARGKATVRWRTEALMRLLRDEG